MSIVKISSGKSAKAMFEYLEEAKKEEQERCTSWESSLVAKSPDDVIRQWDMTRDGYNKHGGLEYYHASLNVAPHDPKAKTITDRELLDMGKQFAERFAPNHDWIAFVHRDKEHPHVHVVWNTVNYETGKKFHQSRKDLYRAFEIKDGLDKEYGLQRIEVGRAKDRIPDKALRLYERKPETYLWTEDLKERICKAKEEVNSFQEYLDKLKSQGVEPRSRGHEEKITYVFEDEKGKQRQIREGKLGKEYERAAIEQEIHNRANERAARIEPGEMEERADRERNDRGEQEIRNRERSIARDDNGAEGRNRELERGKEGVDRSQREIERYLEERQRGYGELKQATEGIKRAERELERGVEEARNVVRETNRRPEGCERALPEANQCGSRELETTKGEREIDRRTEEQQRAEYQVERTQRAGREAVQGVSRTEREGRETIQEVERVRLELEKIANEQSRGKGPSRGYGFER